MKQHNRGFTLFEIIAVIALGSLLLVGLSSMIDTTLDDNKAQQAGFYQAQVVSATMKYMEGKPDFLANKTATGPYAVSLATLQSDGYLSPSFAGANAYGQTPCVLVKRRNAGSGDKLDALIVTAGGTTILDKDLPSAAANAGPGGGYIKADTPTAAIAQGPTWFLSTVELGKFVAPGGCLAGNLSDAGHLASALFYDAGQLATDFLYRNKVSGRPELNMMNTPMLMGAGAVAKEGDPCPGAALAVNDKNDLMSCGTDSRWRQVSTWKTPKATYADLLPTTDSPGDVRMVLDKNRAFVYNGSTWVALAVDQNGNLNVENDIKAGKNVTAGVDIEAQRDLISRAGNIWALASSEMESKYASGVGGDGNLYAYKVTANKVDTHWLGTETILIRQQHDPGDKCNIPTNPPHYSPETGELLHINPVGTFVVDDNRVLLVCASDKTFRYQNGTYKPD